MTTPETPALESLYQEIILDHYRHPHHRGLQESFDSEVHHVNPTCGDEITLRVRVDDGAVAEVTYEGQGCSISQASTSVMSDLVTGRPLAEALALHEEFLTLMQGRGTVEPDEDTLQDAIAFAGVARYPARVKCALLGWMAWKDATAQAVAGAPSPAAPTSGTLDTGTPLTGTPAAPAGTAAAGRSGPATTGSDA